MLLRTARAGRCERHIHYRGPRTLRRQITRSVKLSSSSSARLVRVWMLPRSSPIHDGESQLRQRRHQSALWGTPAGCRRLPRAPPGRSPERLTKGRIHQSCHTSAADRRGIRSCRAPLSRAQPPAVTNSRQLLEKDLIHPPKSPNRRRHCELLRRVPTTLLSVHSVTSDICTMFG